MVRATLAAAGIRGPAAKRQHYHRHGRGRRHHAGHQRPGPLMSRPRNVEAARALLNAPPLSDAELTAEEDADPTTLAEAEASVKNA